MLRAFAVLPVVLFHLDTELMPGGYLGVDVFFVISGYLITRLLVNELAAGKFALLDFWRRRILRILPALVVMVAITFMLGQWLLFAPDRHPLALNSSAALLSFSNITHWLLYRDYWQADSGTSPLLHTWSLGVEEQFYLLYPVLLWLVWTARRSTLTLVLIIGLLLSLGAFLYGLEHHPDATFYMLPTRAWELAAGALSARINWKPEGQPYAAKALSLTGLALVLGAYALAPPDGMNYWSIGAVAGAALVVGAGTDAPFRSIGLTNRVLIFVGLISYSLYLWHWPVIVLGRAASERFGFDLPVVTTILVMGGLSYLSWRFVETPVRRKNNVVPAVAVAAVAVALATFGFRNSNGMEDISGFKPTRWAGHQFNVNPTKEWPADVMRQMAGIQIAEKRSPVDAYLGAGVLHRYGGEGIDVLVLGDSHGLMWSPAIDSIMKGAGKTVSYMTASGTRVFFDPHSSSRPKGTEGYTAAQMALFQNALLQLIRERKPRLVIIGARWSWYTAAQAKPLLDEIAAAGARVILLGDPPMLDIGDRNVPQFVSYLGHAKQPDVWVSRLDLVEYDLARKNLEGISASCVQICQVVETADLFLKWRGGSPIVQVVADSQVLYIDDDHLSVAGAQLASDRIRNAMASVSSQDGSSAGTKTYAH